MQGAPFTADWLGISPLHLTAQYGRYETTEVCNIRIYKENFSWKWKTCLQICNASFFVK